MMARAAPRRPQPGQERTRHVPLRDDLGRLTLRRLRPWHRVLARCAAAGPRARCRRKSRVRRQPRCVCGGLAASFAVPRAGAM